MGIIEEIVQRINQINNLSNYAYVYKSECNYIVKKLNEFRDQIANLSSNSNDVELDNILVQLNNLCTIIDSLENKKWFENNLQMPIVKPINDINNAMNSIIQSLQKIDITLGNNYEMSTENVSDDLNSIYGILADPAKLDDPEVKNKLNEIKEYLDEIGKPIFSSKRMKDKVTLKLESDQNQTTNKHTLSSIYFDEEEDFKEFVDFNDIQKYKLKKSDFIQEKVPLTQASGYSIYKGQLKSNKDEVTITILDPEYYSEDKFKRFISVLTAAKHQNLETFVGAVESPKPYVIVTKRNGQKLSEILKSMDEDYDDKIVIQPGYRTIIAFQIATAMAYLHSLGVIHRDLCSSNVTIDSEFTARVTNFANSRFLPEDFLTMSFKPKSSSEFKAPEINSPDGYNETIDVFSFAGILYELLTGKPPFKGMKPLYIEKMITKAERPNLPPETSDDLRNLIELCWSQDWKKRPSFAEIIDMMLSKTITFPSDSQSEITQQFYSALKIQNVDFKACFDLFKQITKAISNSFVYSHEAFRIRTYIYTYLFLLETSEYASQEDFDDENVYTQIDNLQASLENLLITLKQTEMDKWSSIALSIPALEIPNDMHCFMEEIYISIKQLGFNVIKYNNVNSDLASDLRFVYSIMSNNESIKSQKRKAEIEDFMREKDLELSLTQTEISERIQNLLKYWKDYEVDRKDFKLSAKLGKGVSSEVHRGKQISTNLDVAIKIFNSDYIDDEDCFLLLRRKISSLVSLKNDYLIDFVGFNNDPGLPLWIVSKNIDGGSLDKALKKKNLSPFQKTKIALEIAQGMEYLSLKGTIHRDLKTANVLLENPKSDEVKPKICDFGYARTDMSIEKTSRVGTEFYMAPEVICGGNYDYKADVFSYGMVLFEIYANMRPFYWVEKHDVINQITDDCPLKFEKPINDDLKQLIEDCKNKTPEKRPSFTEIINRMISGKICFTGVNTDQINEFYKKKIEERENNKEKE